MTKSFKIGESAIGGIIEVQTYKDNIIISALDWNTKKTVEWHSFYSDAFDLITDMEDYLNALTTSYYADKVLTWIKSKL